MKDITQSLNLNKQINSHDKLKKISIYNKLYLINKYKSYVICSISKLERNILKSKLIKQLSHTYGQNNLRLHNKIAQYI
ncbi:hypothetical protein pb186bvf_021009 [Paramecium bursaria]